MAEQKSKFFPEYRIYKPNGKGNGFAVKLQMREGKNQNEQERLMLFLEGTQQTGVDDNDNASFGWKDKEKTVVMKLGLVDVGELLAVVNGVKSGAGGAKGLYHENDKGNTTLQFTLMDSKDGGPPVGYWLRLAAKRDSKLIEIKLLVTFGEAEILRVLLSEYVKKLHEWN